jgi:DHA2 family multidrug resistance protein
MIGLPFLFVPSSVMAFSKIPLEQSSKASALYSLLRNLGGSMGISLLLSDVARHQQVHQSSLAEHLTVSNTAYGALLAQYTQTLLNTGHTHVQAAMIASSKIYEQLINQSYILAYADAFRYLAVITLVLAMIALLMPSEPSVAVH